MIINKFLDHVNRDNRHHIAIKSVFGDLGIFCHNAMFALISNKNLYLRGTPDLDPVFKRLNCDKYVLVKKRSISVVNYYNVTDLFTSRHPDIETYIQSAQYYAVNERKIKQNVENRRMRDLPNIHLSIERMIKKAGIKSVHDMYLLGAAQVFVQMKQVFGVGLDNRVLWKIYGALNGLHWELIEEPTKMMLLEQIKAIEVK